MGGHWSSSQQCLGGRDDKDSLSGDGVRRGSSWNGLTPREKQAVKKSMKMVTENVNDNGHQFFLRFFQKFPSYKNYFPSFQDLEVSELRGSIILRAHGTVVIHTLSTIIDKIDDYHLFRTTLHTHIRSHFGRGVRIKNYEGMFEVFTRLLQDKFLSPDDTITVAAWGKVAALILRVMHEAIMEQDLVITRELQDGGGGISQCYGEEKALLSGSTSE